MDAEMVIICAASSRGDEVGAYVWGMVVTDDLEVTPMSAISGITMINKFGVQKGGVQM